MPKQFEIMELPLTPRQRDLVREVYSKMIVELTQDAKKQKVLSVIGKILSEMDLTKFRFKKTPNVKWVLKVLLKNEEFKIKKNEEMIHFVFDEDDEVSSSNNDKGGEKTMPERDYTTKMTSGEEKVAKAVLDHFEAGFKIKNPSRIVFENCLVTAFPKIKNGKAATTNLIKKGWLKESDEKIYLGEKGEKYLSP